jgi:hypothetical protein
MSQKFLSKTPKIEDYWRAIILFGRNVASYKFALAKALLELQPKSGQLLKLEDLALPYARYIAAHLKVADKQGTFASSKFLEACRNFNRGQLSESDLSEQAFRLGFNNVIDAFHIVGQGEIPVRFYEDERQVSAGIRITDEFSRLVESSQLMNLPSEVEARWRLVETAWEMGFSRNLLTINFDAESELLFVVDKVNRRKSVTSSRGALNGYQKGKCFYCGSGIDLTGAKLPEVDHFFSHALKQFGFGLLVDGIWNLVLACQNCNRGSGGKFDRVPTIRLLKKLSERNEFLINSHHPLKETLMRQTGASQAERIAFLNDWHNRARSSLIHQWEPQENDSTEV